MPRTKSDIQSTAWCVTDIHWPPLWFITEQTHGKMESFVKYHKEAKIVSGDIIYTSVLQ